MLFERNHISELDIKKNFCETIKNNIIKNFIKFFYRYADLIIGNSKELCSDLEMLCKTNVKLLYNFYNFKEIKKISNKKIKNNLKFKNNIRIENENGFLSCAQWWIMLKGSTYSASSITPIHSEP